MAKVASELGQSDVLYMLAGDPIYVHSRLATAKIGIAKAKRRIEQILHKDLIPKVQDEINKQLSMIEKIEGEDKNKTGVSIDTVLKSLQGNDIYKNFVSLCMDAKQATKGYKQSREAAAQIGKLDAKTSQTTVMQQGADAVAGIIAELGNNDLLGIDSELEKIRTTRTKLATKLQGMTVSKQHGSLPAGRVLSKKRTGSSGIQQPLGWAFEYGVAHKSINLQNTGNMTGTWRAEIKNLSMQLKGNTIKKVGDKWNKADTKIEIYHNDKLVWTFTTTDKTSGDFITNAKAEIVNWEDAIQFIPTWIGHINNALLEEDAGRIRPDNEHFQSLAKYITLNASSDEDFQDAKDMVLAAMVWSGIVIQVTGLSTKTSESKHTLPLFVRHLTGFYKTSDVLKLLLEKSKNKASRLEIITDKFIDWDYTSWKSITREYLGIEDTNNLKAQAAKIRKKNANSRSEAEKQQLENRNQWVQLWNAKRKAIRESKSDPSYKMLYNSTEVQQALVAINQYYSSVLHLDISLRIDLTNFKNIK